MSDDNWGPWIDWAGGRCPVAPHDYTQVKYRKAGEHEGFALDYSWYHNIMDDDIIAYRVRIPADALLRQAIEALRPFAEFAEAMNENVPDDIALGIFAEGGMRFGPNGGANLGSLRIARAVLTAYDKRNA